MKTIRIGSPPNTPRQLIESPPLRKGSGVPSTSTMRLNHWRHAAASPFEQSAIVSHHQVAVNLLNQVERDTHSNQQSGAAVEAGDRIGHAERAVNNGWDDGDNRQERGTDVRDSYHDLFQVIGGPLAGTIAGNERPTVTQVVRHLLGIERDRRPEVAEEENQTRRTAD